MPEEGPTCPSCLTTNPPGAPACLRCNQPLTSVAAVAVASPGEGDEDDDEFGIGATSARTRTRGKPERRPKQARPPRPEKAPKPGKPQKPGKPAKPPTDAERAWAQLPAAERRRISRRVQLAGAAVLAAVVIGGVVILFLTRPKPIDGQAVAREIEAGLAAKGYQASVECPDAVERKAGVVFTCQATDSGRNVRAVRVTVTGDDGAYRWNLG